MDTAITVPSTSSLILILLTLTLLSLSTAAGDNDEAGDDIDRQGIDSEMEGFAADAAAPLFDNCFVEITFFLVGVGDVRMV